MRDGRAIDMQGKRFERLLVLNRSGAYRGNATWVCRCDCGTETIITGANLRNGSTRSCGCLHRELTQKRNKGLIRHGHASHSRKTPEYMAFQNAVAAKQTPVCKRWRTSFAAFLADMGCKPSPDHWLIRLDKAKGYSPSNCAWRVCGKGRNTD